MKRYTVAVLVKNQFGVLNRVTSMFRRRQFNILALTVSETESSEYSRITVVFDGEEFGEQQLVNQLYKLPDVVSIKEINDSLSVSVELMLIKVEYTPQTRDEILAAAKAFEAKTIDYAKDSVIFRLTSDSLQLDRFIELMRQYKILEICRTGVVSLERGNNTIRKIINY